MLQIVFCHHSIETQEINICVCIRIHSFKQNTSKSSSHLYRQMLFIKASSCRLKFGQSAFIRKEFCMQKNKVKAFICCCFSVMSKKNECGINWKSSTIKTFLFQTHLRLDPEGLGVFIMVHTVNIFVLFCQARLAYIVLDHSHVLQNWVCHKNSVTNLWWVFLLCSEIRAFT